MKMKKIRAGKRVTPTLMVVCVIGACAIVAFAQNGKKLGAAPIVQANTNRTTSATTVAMVTAAERKPLVYYTGQVRADLFTVSTPEAAKPVVPLVKPTPPAPPVVVDPFADFTYSGTVTIDDQPMALIENTKTRTGEYYKVGDTFMAAKILSIDDRLITLDVAGQKKLLAKSDDFSLIPLSKSAAFMQPAPPGQPGAPGAPGAPAAAPGGMQFPGMQNLPADVQERIRARFGNMTPEQQQQWQNRRMNSQFDGNNGRGGRGWGGGGGGWNGGGGRRNRGGGGGGGMGGG